MAKTVLDTEHFFITGVMGCLGAWVAKTLVGQGIPVTGYDLSTNRHRLKLIMSKDEIDQINFIQGDITNVEEVIGAVQESGATRLIHLAALQVPFCKANPSLGAEVNVVGTVNLFEAAKQAGIRQLTYASSVAVFGPKSEYPQRLLPHGAPLNPKNLYGVYKQANEGSARIYWQDEGISSIGLRPYTLYGPGRDQGMTSTPTKAMLAAARGRPYHISYGGYNGFQLAGDVAKIFIQAARRPIEGAELLNLQGAVAHMSEVVAAIEEAEPESRGKITFEEAALPFPDGLDDSALTDLLGEVPDTPLAEGVKFTVEHFKRALQNGQIALLPE
jgi:nucleoside-diphosphate-sugar epimerase